MTFGVSGVQVGSKNRAKIHEKMRSTWEGILASIFNGFWWILGAKLGPSWEGKSSQDKPRQAKTREDKGSEGKGRERKRKGRDCKGKVWKSVDEEFFRPGGEGFAGPLGGVPPGGPGNLVPDRPAGSHCVFFAILVTFLFSSLFRCLFGSIFARFSTPTCLPKSTKIAQKSMPRSFPC